ncbi:MAG: hypothetical protein IK130_08015 [Oscillospiraceae bacterium]|nr:hypothetical protein [Oscillospiraceae bacterium]
MNEITTRILRLLLLIFAVVLASSIFYHLFFQGYETENAMYYEVRDVAAFQGVYVRDEHVQEYRGTGAVRYCVDDGAKLGIGSVIAEVYANGEQIDLRKRIAARQEELEALQKVENPGTSESAQPVALAALIKEQYKNLIRRREENLFSQMADSKRELTTLLSTYDKITDPAVDYSARIRSLESEIAELSARLTEPVETITAKESAYFVSYVDGYEPQLTVKGIPDLTPDFLATVTDDVAEHSTENGAIGKLVESYAWYIVGVFDNTKTGLSDGDTANMRLESAAGTIKVQAEKLTQIEGKEKTLGVFRCEQMSYDTVQHRTERVELLRDAIKGVRVPRSAIRFKTVEETVVKEDGTTYTQDVRQMGVYVLVGETAEFRKLKVLHQEDEFYISDMDAGSGYVALYDEIIVKGVKADEE